MGCFDGQGNTPETPIDTGVTGENAKGAGGFNGLRFLYGSLFRYRGFLDSSAQAHTEAPDPLFRTTSKKAPFAILAQRGTSGGA